MTIGWDEIAWDGVALPGIAGKVALVTGGTGAIGGRVTMALAAAGMRVGVMGRSPDLVHRQTCEVPPALGDRLLAVPGDVSDPADATDCVETLVERCGRLDVLVHAAAIGDSGALLAEMTVAEVDRLHAVNVRGTLLMAQAAAVPMRAQGGGSMILLASVAAGRAGPRGLMYGATKAAVVRMARQLAIELGPDGIRVNAVSPGQTPTVLRGVDERPGSPAMASPGGNEEAIPLRRRGRLDDYAGPVLFLASDLAAYVTGTDLLVDGGVAIRR
ncbi:MAG: SDR family oxidoreductase [Streptosporangiales bacterium]|nr:SDR family oxidoreductase [Streptosporangiales bacterium]